MKKSILFALLLVSTFAFAAKAQDDFNSSRLQTAANELKRVSAELVARSSNDLRGSSVNTKIAIEEAFLAQQLDSSTGLFQQMIDDRRKASELRDAAAILTNLASRAPSSGTNGNLWRNVQDSVNSLNRELSEKSGGSSGETVNTDNTGNNTILGRVYWRGTVDDKVQLSIRDRSIETKVIGGRAYPEGTYSFTAFLPSREVSVGINKTKGRGSVRVVQQPLQSNDFTAIVEIYDEGGGAKEYQLDIFWK